MFSSKLSVNLGLYYVCCECFGKHVIGFHEHNVFE